MFLREKIRPVDVGSVADGLRQADRDRSHFRSHVLERRRRNSHTQRDACPDTTSLEDQEDIPRFVFLNDTHHDGNDGSKPRPAGDERSTMIGDSVSDEPTGQGTHKCHSPDWYGHVLCCDVLLVAKTIDQRWIEVGENRSTSA